MINFCVHKIRLLFIILSASSCFTGWAQIKKDTLSKEVPLSKLNKVADTLKDRKVDSVIHVHSPRKAIIRSAIIPGLGQIYNKKYWKLPIVYGALGSATAVFIFNLKWYQRTRYAYKVLYTNDSGNFKNVYSELQPLLNINYINSLRTARDDYRKNVDYSVLAFIFLWGLNVVDAAVDAHLKTFDVSPDLTLQLKTGYSEMARTNGVSLVLSIK